MAETANLFLTDPWQAAAALHTFSGSESTSTERLRSILRIDTETISSKILESNRSVDEEARSRPQIPGQGTRRVQSAGLLPEILPSAPSEGKLDRFKLLQKWEGTVSRCTETEFTAVLREKGEPDQEATFDVEEVPEGDRGLIVPGAIFHWSIGYRDRRGQRTRESVIRFRRLPAWNKREIERARQEADEIITALRWGELQAPR